MANRHRGETGLHIGAQERVACLTMASLAELEDELGADDLSGLLDLLSCGPLDEDGMAAIVRAGLRGGGASAAIAGELVSTVSGASLATMARQVVAAAFPGAGPASQAPKAGEPGTAGLDLSEALARGVAGLGLTPAEFWRLGVAEFAALAGRFGRPAPARPDIDALMRRFPD